jgi:hypothetical protein
MSTLRASQLQASAASNWMITVEPGSYLYSPGMILQTVYVRSDLQTTYASAVTGNGTALAALNITITPRRADSLLMCTWMINGEINQNNVFLVHKDGALITTAGYQAYNNVAGNQRWSGLVSAAYDNNDSTTMSNYYLHYAVPAGSTAAATYAPAIRASGATAYSFFFNRIQNSAGADAQEISVSTGMIQEIAQ